MPKLPTDLSGSDVRTTLERAGFIFRRQTGSYMILRRGAPYARVVVPDRKQVRSGTLRRIIADVWGADLTLVEREFTLVGVNPALDDFKELAGQFKDAAHAAAAQAGKALATA